MSSILKALKKLEEERGGRIEAGSPGRIGGQFVASQGRQPWLLIACGVGCGLLLAGAAYLLAARPDILPSPSPAPGEAVSTGPPVTVAIAASTAVPAAALPPGTIKRTEPRVRVAPSAGVAVPPAKAGPVSSLTTVVTPSIAVASPAPLRPPVVAPASSPPSATITEPIPSTVEPRALPVRDEIKQVHVERREIPAPGQQWAAPHLTVSDIMPASGGGGRMAIVNGLPVMEGTMVDNAVVREIRSDQVVFEIDGKSVVVPLAVP
jgi:hypothetical protein